MCLKSGSIENDLLRVMTKKNGKPGFSGPTIIYCPTRNATEEVYKKLNGIAFLLILTTHKYQCEIKFTIQIKYSFLNVQDNIYVKNILRIEIYNR